MGAFAVLAGFYAGYEQIEQQYAADQFCVHQAGYVDSFEYASTLVDTARRDQAVLNLFNQKLRRQIVSHFDNGMVLLNAYSEWLPNDLQKQRQELQSKLSSLQSSSSDLHLKNRQAYEATCQKYLTPWLRKFKKMPGMPTAVKPARTDKLHFEWTRDLALLEQPFRMLKSKKKKPNQSRAY